jgi:hypothetical protein
MLRTYISFYSELNYTTTALKYYQKGPFLMYIETISKIIYVANYINYEVVK